MKKLLFITIALLMLWGCDDSFDPKADFEDMYVVSSVIQYDIYNDPVNVTVYLTKLYDVEKTNPDDNNIDPSVSGADVRYSQGNTVYQLTETEVPHYDPERYDSTMIAYTGTAVAPRPGDALFLDVVTPDNKVLSSSIELPKRIYFEQNYEFPRGFTTSTTLSEDGANLIFRWDTEPEFLYFPSLNVDYTVSTETGSYNSSISLPQEYIDDNGTEVPYNQEYIFNGYMNYKFGAIDKAIASILEKHPDNTSINLNNLTFSLTVFEKNLAKYYSSTNGYLDALSIRLDEIVYSNISGGLGIFGASHTTEVVMTFDRSYANNLGFSN